MKSLQRISIEIIVSKLNWNYKLCEKNNWKIPKRIGDKIFEFAFKYKKPLNDDDMLIFQRKITELSEFHCSKGRFDLSNYDFLLNHHLEKFSLRNVVDFNVDYNSSKLYTKSFNIKQDELPEKNIENFLKKNLHVESSISVDVSNNNTILRGIFSLIENCSSNLRILSIKCLNVNWKYLKTFFIKFPEMKNLEKFKLKLYHGQTLDKSYGNSLLDSLINLTKNLKSLIIPMMPFSYSSMIRFLEKCQSLEEIDIYLKNWHDEFNEFDVLRCLIRHKYLKKAYLVFGKFREETEKELINFFRESNCIKKLKVSFHHEEKPRLNRIMNSIKPFSNNLQSIDIFGMYYTENLSGLKDVFSGCRSLTKIDVTYYGDVKKMLPSLEEAIIQSKNTLKEIFLPGFMADELVSCLKLLIDSNCLENLYFEQCINSKESDKVLLNVVDTCKRSLKSFSWFSTSSNLTFEVDLLKSFSKCSALTTLQIVDLNLTGKLHYLINESSAYLENLDELCLMSVMVNEEDIMLLSNTLKMCPNLRNLDLNGTFGSENSLKHFCTETKDLQQTLDNFSAPKPCSLSDEEDFIEYDYDDFENDENSDGIF